MAKRLLNRRAIREQNDQADGAAAEPAVAAAATKAAPKNPPAKPRARRKAVKVPPVLFARWAVCDNGMKRVAVFGYRDRAAADAKLAEMLERKAGGYFLQMVKDPQDPPAPTRAP